MGRGRAAGDDPHLGPTAYDPGGPMGQGDRLDYRRAWTIGSTIELYDPRTKQRQAVLAAGQALTVVAATSGAVVFCVILVDAAGHAGDGDCTGSIALMAE